MQNQFDPECKSCESFLGKISLTPIPTIFESDCWRVQHIDNTSIKGWLVVALKRHAAALHELSDQEWEELGELQKVIVRGLHSILKTQKEYILQLAEANGFNHVHFHLVPVMEDMSRELRGANIFNAHGPAVIPSLQGGDLDEFGVQLSEFINKNFAKKDND